MNKKKLKIEFADQTVVAALQPYIDELLGCLAEIIGHEGIKYALVSDESMICDFMEHEKTGRKIKHPYKDKMIDSVTADTSNNHRLLADISQKLGVEVGVKDYIYEVAIRIRDK